MGFWDTHSQCLAFGMMEIKKSACEEERHISHP